MTREETIDGIVTWAILDVNERNVHTKLAVINR